MIAYITVLFFVFLRKICNEFQAKEVVLYGSRAKETARERSDIDIAVSGVNDFEKVVKQLEM